MNTIKWNESGFRSSNTYFWVYNNGKLESTNNKSGNIQLLKNYRRTCIRSSAPLLPSNIAVKR
ncbi:MAG: hypothetical protein IAE93_10540 [Ignavibacteria bacterium]|nr:hypothetical protein [Ignavibacteria bacterium]